MQRRYASLPDLSSKSHNRLGSQTFSGYMIDGQAADARLHPRRRDTSISSSRALRYRKLSHLHSSLNARRQPVHHIQ